MNQRPNHKTILVVEDETPLTDAIKAKLQKNGFEVVTARSVEQALGNLNVLKQVDAIWLDHYLIGKETGLDLVRNIKNADGKWQRTPIFIVSNTASRENVKSYMDLGITKYYVKANHLLDGIVSDIKSFLDNSKK